MKVIHTISSLLLIALCISCSMGKGIDIEISNQSGTEVSNVTFTTSEHLDSLVLKPIKDKSYLSDRLSMAENITDGGYILRFTCNGKEEIVASGYYTNGGPMDSSVSYVIKADTVLVTFDPSY